jgi:hypothetical protein
MGPLIRNVSSRRLRTAALVGMLAVVATIVYFASLVAADVYSGVPASVPVTILSVHCDSGATATPCEASVVALNPGRFHVAASIPGSTITVRWAEPPAPPHARFLLARSALPGRLQVSGDGGALSTLGELPAGNARHVFALPIAGDAANRIIFTPPASPRPSVIDELGFFADDRGLLRSARQPWQRMAPQRFYLRYVPIVTLVLCVLIVVAGYLLDEGTLRRLGPWLVAGLSFAVAMLEIGTTFSPYWGRDLRSYYASEWLPIGPDSNLTGGLYEASRLLQGLGLTVRPDVVQWHRMPGYGLFCAFAAAAARTTDVIEIASAVVVFQVLLYAIAAGVLVFAAQRLFRPWVALLIGVLIALLPKQLSHTQGDSIIVPILLLVLAALLAHLAAERDSRVTFRHFLWVNLAFAFWFFVRNDVLPGWIVVAAVLAAPRWRRMTVPLLLALGIAVPWGIYKQPYRHEFDLMPTNTGEVLLLSLCEVPGRFPFECTDVGYVDWARRAGHFDPATNSASLHAVREVVRHWVTYPVHFGVMVFAKARRAVTTESFPGFQTRFNRIYGVGGDTWLFAILLTAMVSAVAVNHQRRRTLLLGWAVLLNMPLFFVTFASAGRFNAAAGASLIVATVPLLADRAFYAALRCHPWRAAVVIACVTAFVTAGSHLERVVMANDTFHYWTPLLDPDRSTLKMIGR